LAERWYVDSSIVLRIVKEGSPAARAWFDRALADGDDLVTSRFMVVEVLRVLQNAGLSTAVAREVISRFTLLVLDDALADDAVALPGVVGGADALHLASAMRVGTTAVTVVTHDLQMARAASGLGFAVCDPVTDDPAYPRAVTR